MKVIGKSYKKMYMIMKREYGLFFFALEVQLP